MLRRSSLVVLISVVVGACGGSAEGGGAAEPTPQSSTAAVATAPAKPLSDEERLRAAQEQGCDGYCQRVTECAVTSAKETMSPEELAELNLQETAPALRSECTSECTGSALSVRQVEVMHTCLREKADDCDAFVECMEAMDPEKK